MPIALLMEQATKEVGAPYMNDRPLGRPSMQEALALCARHFVSLHSELLTWDGLKGTHCPGSNWELFTNKG